jgi:nitric oxide reductase activation protein
MTSLEAEEEQDTQEKESSREESAEKKKIIVAGQEEMSRMYSFVERNFGRSYLSPAEQKRRNYQMCRGVHAGCRLYYTDGILNSPVIKNNQYVLAERVCRDTRKKYKEQYTLVNRNIRTLADMLRKALVLRDEDQFVRADHGRIVPSQLWKPGRSGDSRLFIRRMKSDSCDFAVDLLLDASGSQRKRQSDVALQAFIISEALSELDIPVRVMSFCTFWNYTVLRRFREYDEDRAANRNIFSFTTSSGNRDGLAVRAVGSDLLQREERNKILIVLSDGKPNDTLLNRPGAEHAELYRGRRAILDTGTEIRNLRRNHVAVLGVFVGDETELQAEKKIFGKDFAYIRSIRGFSNTVGRYLLMQIEDE